MASVFKPEGRTKYSIKYKDEHGKWRKAVGYRDKKASQAKGDKLERDAERLRSGLPVTDAAVRFQPIAELAQLYLDELKMLGCSHAHIRDSTRLLRTVWQECGWETLSAVRPDQFGKFLAKLQALDRAPRTLNSYRDALAAFLDFARRQRWVEENVIRLSVPKAKAAGGQKKRPRRAYTIEEFTRLLDKTRNHRDIYLTAGLSGLRKSELARLEKRDLSPEGDSPTWHLRAEIDKSRRRNVVPIHPELLAVLRERWRACQRPTSKLFPRIPRTQTLNKDLRRAKIKKKDAEGRLVDFHALRYFFCTQMAKHLPIQTVRLLMRHADIRMTFNLYCDLGLTDLHEAVIKLPAVFGPALGPKKQSAEEE